MSREGLLSALAERSSAESERNSISARIKKIRKDLNELKRKSLMSKINETRRNLYEIKNEENIFKPKKKKIEKNLIELEKSLYYANKYHNFDAIEYCGIKDIENLFREVADEDYYKPTKTIGSFNNKNNYMEYESKGDKNKNLSPKEYLYTTIPHLRDMINDHKTPMKLKVHSRDEIINNETQFGEWKIQLTMQISFISSRDSGETRTMRTKSDNMKIMMGSETYDIINELNDSLFQRYQELKKSMRGSEFIFDSVDLLYYHLQKTSLKRGESYIKSPKWLKNKKAKINPKNNDDNCFQYSVTVALDHQQIEKKPSKNIDNRNFYQKL